MKKLCVILLTIKKKENILSKMSLQDNSRYKIIIEVKLIKQNVVSS